MGGDGGGRTSRGLSAPDLADPGTYEKGPPYPLWAELREHDPVHWNRSKPGFWALTGFHDVRRVLRDPDTFPSGEGNMLTVLGGRDAGGGKMLAVTDGERHASLSRATARLLARTRDDDFDVAVAEAARRFTRRVRAGADAAASACSFTAESTGALLGLPTDIWEEANRQAVASVVAGAGGPPPGGAQMRMLQLLRGEALGEPVVGGLVSRLRHVEHDGTTLARDEVLLNAYGLLLGASVTTGHVLSRMVLLAAEAPATWQMWRRVGATRESVDEAVRWATPAAHFMRTAARDVELGDVVVRAGDAVTVWLGAANRDPSAFADPDRMVLDRGPNPHVGFGFGVHHCVGAHLARSMLEVVLGRLLHEVDEVRVGEHSWHRSSLLTGLRTLTIETRAS